MANPGASPIDTASPVGALRILVGDMVSRPLDPPVAGQADYAVWSDQELLSALAITADEPYRAAGNLYASLAGFYARKGRVVKADDLNLSTVSRSSDLRAIAKTFHDQADSIAATGAADFFEIVQPEFQVGGPWVEREDHYVSSDYSELPDLPGYWTP